MAAAVNKVLGGQPRPGQFNVIVTTDASSLTDNHPVCDDYKDDKGNVIETGLPCADTSIAIDATTHAVVKILMGGTWM